MDLAPRLAAFGARPECVRPTPSGVEVGTESHHAAVRDIRFLIVFAPFMLTL